MGKKAEAKPEGASLYDVKLSMATEKISHVAALWRQVAEHFEVKSIACVGGDRCV